MSNKLKFRSLEEGQEAELEALWEACGLVRPWNKPQKDIEFAMSGDESDILVAEENGAIIASVMVGHDGHRGIVYYVSVHPDAQGKGYGKQVMQAAESWLKHRGVWKLNLLVRAENEKVRGFYENIGFSVEPRLCMAKKLLA